MMNREVLESSLVQHLQAAGNPHLWNKVSGGLMPPQPPPQQLPPCTNVYLLPSLSPNYLPSPTSSSSSSSSPSLPPTRNPNFCSCLENDDDMPLDQPWSLSQLLSGGLLMENEERIEMINHRHQKQQQSYQEKKLENWEEQVLRHQASIKQEVNNNNGFIIMSSPLNKSCVTTTTFQSLNVDSNNNNHNGLNFSEEYAEIGGSCFANKKPKLQLPSIRPSPQSTLKVRKEKLGGRIAALHQLVSPYGKTDTASVLSEEAIGYIRFLHSQIEVLCVPYFGTPWKNNMLHQHVQGAMNGLFPQDTGQLVHEYCMKRSKGAASSSSTKKSNLSEETKKDLKSRGLCLVPISCTLQVGAEYWPPALGITFQ